MQGHALLCIFRAMRNAARPRKVTQVERFFFGNAVALSGVAPRCQNAFLCARSPRGVHAAPLTCSGTILLSASRAGKTRGKVFRSPWRSKVAPAGCLTSAEQDSDNELFLVGLA